MISLIRLTPPGYHSLVPAAGALVVVALVAALSVAVRLLRVYDSPGADLWRRRMQRAAIPLAAATFLVVAARLSTDRGMRRSGVRRRAGLVAVAAVLVAGVLAACGGSTPSTAGSAALTAQRVPSARGTAARAPARWITSCGSCSRTRATRRSWAPRTLPTSTRSPSAAGRPQGSTPRRIRACPTTSR